MRKVFIVLAIFLLSSGLFAGQPVIAVFHFENETQSGNYRLPDNTLRIIEEKLRSELIKTQQFEVMTNDSMEKELAQHKAESYNSNRDKAYQIRLGQKISARYIVIGKIKNDGQDYTVFAEIIDTQRESSIGAGNADFVNNKESRDRAVNSIIKQLLGGGGRSYKDRQTCEYARKDGSLEVWQDYLSAFPDGICSVEAKQHVRQLLKAQAKLKAREKEAAARKAAEEARKKTTWVGSNMWSSRSTNMMDWDDAKYYCNTLNEDGYYDWRLPTISELRTLVINCENTEPGGYCGVRDNCWSYICADLTGCLCDQIDTDRGYYSKLGDNYSLWSSSVVTFHSKEAWVINFNFAWVENYEKDWKIYVRCVR